MPCSTLVHVPWIHPQGHHSTRRCSSKKLVKWWGTRASQGTWSWGVSFWSEWNVWKISLSPSVCASDLALATGYRHLSFRHLFLSEFFQKFFFTWFHWLTFIWVGQSWNSAHHLSVKWNWKKIKFSRRFRKEPPGAAGENHLNQATLSPTACGRPLSRYLSTKRKETTNRRRAWFCQPFSHFFICLPANPQFLGESEISSGSVVLKKS